MGKFYTFGNFILTIILCVFCFTPLSFLWSQQPYNFSFSNLSGAAISDPTSLQFGPDGRLYVSEQGGLIKVFTVKRNGLNSYSASATETIDLINKIPNHNDDGKFNPAITARQITGILVVGTASSPVIYVASSDSRMGGPSGDLNLDTNSGIISLLTWDDVKKVWTKIDLVRGLPRSEENHACNGMQLITATNTLYVAQGGHTNAGSPSTNFAFTCEYALSAAILSINLTAINQMPTKGSGNTAYKYDLPTLNDPTRTDSLTDIDSGDPFGGNDGLNQAKLVTGSPVQIFATGFRNAYDILITKKGNIYTCDNGGNQGWGGYPENEGTPNVTNNYITGEPGSSSPSATEATTNNLDNFHYIGNINTYVPGSFYGGHPNPIRANPNGAGLWTQTGNTGVWRTSKTNTANPLPSDWPPVSVANPIEGDFQMPGVGDNALLTFNMSTNGLAEYTASNFGNALKGSILACNYNGYIEKINLTADGTGVTNAKSSTNKLNQDPHFASGFGSQPLDVVAQGDSDVFPGTVWVCLYGSKAITIFEPQDFTTCTGAYNNSDDDGDGYTNADEVDNSSNPCSAASVPPDNDLDHLSDLNDPDDDNDSIDDTKDFFVLDKDNGLKTNLPIAYDLFNNYPQTGFYGVGFTGLMNNGASYSTLYADDNLIAGGASGAFTIVSVSAGDALGTLNTQQNAFQFGVKPADKLPFTVQSRLTGPFFNNKPQDYQSQGIYIGTGDQDNYLKIALTAKGGTGGIEIVNENKGVAVTASYAVPGILSASTIDFYFSVDPATGNVQPRYALNKGSSVAIGPPVKVSDGLLAAIQGAGTSAPAYAVGIIATSRGASPFTASWDFINITSDAILSPGTWTTFTPVSGSIIGREENSYVAAGDKFYLLGGRGIVAVQEFDPVKNTWINKAKPPVELNHFQGINLNGLIYVVGAMNGSYPHEVPLSSIYVYNPTSDKWFTGGSIPAGRRRGAAGAVLYKNKIYVTGGITDGHWAGWVNWFDEYDPATNTWKTLPDAPRARDHFNAVVINDKLYIAGGRRSSASTNQVFDLTIPEVDVYDFTNGTWSTLPSGSNLPVPRAGSANVVLNNEVVVIGGESGTQTASHKETHALNVTTYQWRRLADLQTGRHGTGAIVSNKDIYIATGPSSRGGTPLILNQEDYFMTTHSAPNGTPLAQSPLSAAAALDLGTVAVNTESTKVVTLRNSGSDQGIILSTINITGASAFSYTAPYALPFALAPGMSVDITVKFKPVASGSQTATLTITHSGQSGSATTSLSGSGAGETTGPQITSFTLVNASTNQDIQTLNSGDVLNLATLPGRILNIRANASTSTKSVVFNLSGKSSKNQTESTLPFALYGDDMKGNYNDWTPAVGSYTLKGTPYSSTGGTGTSGSALTINFSVVDQSTATPAITTFTLVNASTNQDIQTLNNGAVLNLTTLPGSLNIRANTSTSTKSVVFNLSGATIKNQTESLTPFALYGDDMKGDYNDWTPVAGSYTLKGTPYASTGGSGTVGTALTVNFSVMNGATTLRQKTQLQEETSHPAAFDVTAYPNPNNKGRYTILLPKDFEGNTSFALLSAEGSTLTSGQLSLIKTRPVLAFDFSRVMVSSGVYYLILENNRQKAQVVLMFNK